MLPCYVHGTLRVWHKNQGGTQKNSPWTLSLRAILVDSASLFVSVDLRWDCDHMICFDIWGALCRINCGIQRSFKIWDLIICEVSRQGRDVVRHGLNV